MPFIDGASYFCSNGYFTQYNDGSCTTPSTGFPVSYTKGICTVAQGAGAIIQYIEADISPASAPTSAPYMAHSMAPTTAHSWPAPEMVYLLHLSLLITTLPPYL